MQCEDSATGDNLNFIWLDSNSEDKDDDAEIEGEDETDDETFMMTDEMSC